MEYRKCYGHISPLFYDARRVFDENRHLSPLNQRFTRHGYKFIKKVSNGSQSLLNQGFSYIFHLIYETDFDTLCEIANALKLNIHRLLDV